VLSGRFELPSVDYKTTILPSELRERKYYMKNITVVYRPGYGGHFLQRLFSLDLNTKPVVNAKDYPSFIDTLDSRLSYYSFNNVTKFNHWSDFHFYDLHQHPNNNYHTRMLQSHCTQFNFTTESDVLLVTLSKSKFANCFIEGFRASNNYFPAISNTEVQLEEKITNTRNYITVDLDKFFSDDWIDEYIRISSLLNIDIHIQHATSLYHSWHSARIVPVLKMFNKLTDHDHARLLEIRLAAEVNGDVTPSNIVKIYNIIRTEHWPFLWTDADVKSIPADILSELREQI
jgi:hypothetical protein